MDELNYFLVSQSTTPHTNLSTRDGFRSVAMADGLWSVSLKTLSMRESSVLVVSRPQKALQSFTTKPAPITSLPRFTVPAWDMEKGTRKEWLLNRACIFTDVCSRCGLALAEVHPAHGVTETNTWPSYKRCGSLKFQCRGNYLHIFGVGMTKLIRLTTSGTCNREDNSSWSSTLVLG